MKKLKDFIYDYNDIVLALLIIVVAGAVIFWKTTDIMAYPAYAKAQQQASQQQTDVNITDEDLQKVDVEPIVAPGEDLEGKTQTVEPNQTVSDTPQVNQVGEGPSVKKDTTFTVPSGYVGSKIASKLESEGLCKAEDFTAAVTKLDAEKKLRAGDFILPAGSTAEDIVKIIANIK